MGPGRHFVHYFVSGGRLVNFVAVVEQDTWTRESWTDRGEVADALAAFAGWHPQVRTILGAVDETFVWALFDRAPLERWSAGRVTLLGDACHAMVPFMAQGAAMAIEDGATLAACLAAGGVRPGRGAAPLRGAARPARGAPAGAVDDQQDALPPPRRPGTGRARRRDGRGRDGLVVQGRRLDLRARRRGGGPRGGAGSAPAELPADRVRPARTVRPSRRETTQASARRIAASPSSPVTRGGPAPRSTPANASSSSG